MRLVLAPMEGLLDAVLRDVLTRVEGYDWAVAEFVRVSDSLLPHRAFTRICPELARGGATRAGTPVRVQLLGSDPSCVADNAAHLARLDPPGIDLNFGCPKDAQSKPSSTTRKSPGSRGFLLSQQ